jgi:hypothetical protein|tara:strand:+ start:1229 stop:1753 length:525 start_codon:yes stop_codon:yes gene_type:complete
MNIDLGADVSYFAWKAQEKCFNIDGNNVDDLKNILIDPKSLKIGQGKLEAGVEPEWIWNEVPTERTQLKEGFKKAFQVKIYIPQILDWREWASNQSGSSMAIKELFMSDEFIKGHKKHPGKMCEVQLEGARHEKFKKGSTNVPILKIVGWGNPPKEEDTILENDLLEDEIPDFG